MAIFEFTTLQTQPALEEWYKWFAGRGIPVAVVEHADVRYPERFAVWRGTEDRSRSDRWFAAYKVVKATNSFPKPKFVMVPKSKGVK